MVGEHDQNDPNDGQEKIKVINKMVHPKWVPPTNDYDLAIRLAYNGKGMYIAHNSGYYLNEGMGLSTRPDSKQALERTVIEMRYGIPVIEPRLENAAREYDIKNIHIDGEKYPANQLV